jgi:hypothetical protein
MVARQRKYNWWHWTGPLRTVNILGCMYLSQFFWQSWTLHLLSRHSTAWATPPALSALIILEVDSRFFAQGSLDQDLPTYASQQRWGDRCTPPPPNFFHWDGILLTFCPVWPVTSILPISVSYVAWDNRCIQLHRNGVLWTPCPGWPQTAILPISVSQIVMISGISHQHPANTVFLIQKRQGRGNSWKWLLTH